MSQAPELRNENPSKQSPESTHTGDPTRMASSNNNNNSNSRRRLVNERPANNARKPILNALQRISRNPSSPCEDSLEQTALTSDLMTFEPTPGTDMLIHNYIQDAIKRCENVVHRLKQDVHNSEKNEIIKTTNENMKAMLKYAVFRFKKGIHRQTLLEGVLALVNERAKKIGHVTGDSRLKHDIIRWIRYVKGKGPMPGTRRRNHVRKEKKTRKVGNEL